MSIPRLGARLRLCSVTAAAILTVASPLQAADGDKRLVLVIGNSAYQNITRLTNPVNDATDLAEKLRKNLKFEVLLATDASQAKMSSLLREFTTRLTREHVGLFFYAGHGITVSKESFLLP